MSYFKKKLLSGLKFFIGTERFVSKRFHFHQNYKLNLNNPKTFSEKIQWLKIRGNLEKYGDYVDKYEVRSYVSNKVGEEYLIPLLGVVERTKDINYNNLPNSFVIKATHGSGWNKIIKDKKEIEETLLNEELEKWLSLNYYRITSEKNYKNIKPRLVIEELIGDFISELEEYKVFCFNGAPKFIQVDKIIDGNKHRNLYDTEWRKIDISYKYPNLKEDVSKPVKLKEILEIAESLSEDFNFARIDLYYEKNKIYFGEITLTPGGGYQKFSNYEYDLYLGNLLKINEEF